MTPDFKITIIGAGSVGFTKKLVSDILKVPEFAAIEIALTDISAHNLEMIEKIIRRIVEVNGLPTRITATTDRRARARRRPLRHELRPHRRPRGLRRRHPHPAEVRRRPVRRRHHLRRRHHVRPARHPGDARLLQGHARGRRARRAVPQLRQPDGDDDLGLPRPRRRRDHRPLPRRAERLAPDRRAPSASRRTPTSTSSAPASTTRPGTSACNHGPRRSPATS